MGNLLCRSLVEFINSPLIIIGLILIAFGLAFVILAKRITRVARQVNEVENDERIYVGFKIAGILLILAGCICISIDIILYIINKRA